MNMDIMAYLTDADKTSQWEAWEQEKNASLDVRLDCGYLTSAPKGYNMGIRKIFKGNLGSFEVNYTFKGDYNRWVSDSYRYEKLQLTQKDFNTLKTAVQQKYGEELANRVTSNNCGIEIVGSY